MSDGCEFQVCAATMQNARLANTVHVLAADSSGHWMTVESVQKRADQITQISCC